ncbi:MAG: hypothetical protein RG741_02340 [Bacteroidales bacterium]|nr:hypothetical protein [Bacteroidales bacterium]
MKNKKNIHAILILCGLLLFFVSVFGYPLGIAHRPAFGAFQILGTVTGAVIVVYSIFQMLKK